MRDLTMKESKENMEPAIALKQIKAIKMTEIECLEKMIKVWQYVYDNPTEDKYAAYAHLNLPTDKHDCPCCHYMYQFINTKVEKLQDCKNFCPLINLWPQGCEAENTCYTRWCTSDNLRVKKAAAGEILKATKVKLRRLQNALIM